MRDRFKDLFAKFEKTIMEAPGETRPSDRGLARAGRSKRRELEAYFQKLRETPYRVTDEDVANLLEKGSSEDAVFELTLSAALGAASERLSVGLEAILACGLEEGGSSAPEET